MPYCRYSLQCITQALQSERPELSPQEAAHRALLIRRELNRLYVAWRRSQARYHSRVFSLGISFEHLQEDSTEIF